MIGFLFKNWKLFLDIILVVGGILAFTFWDPLGIFTNTKLQATANMVSGVRDIGQLVTAEYYGEVIGSYKELKLNETPEDTITINAEKMFVDLKAAFGNVEKSFKEMYQGNELKAIKANDEEEIYDKFLAFIGKEMFNFNTERIFDEKKNKLKGKYEEKILKKLYKNGWDYYKSLKKEYRKDDAFMIEVEYKNYLSENPDFIEKFYHMYGYLTKQNLDAGSKKRSSLVMIGRGSVKAGFDFGKLNEGNFMYDKDNKSVHFFGITPEILDTDINPWFIPEQKVKGFELVSYSNAMTFEDAREVKIYCKQKLLDQANRADIIKKALENGEEALKSFFSLILDEPDIRVKFHTHPFELHFAMIVADTLIDINEALFIQSLYQSEMKKWKPPSEDGERSIPEKRQQLFWYFVNQLKELNFIDSAYRFNFYSMAAADVLSDTFHISLDDRKKLIALRDTLMPTIDSLDLTTSAVPLYPGWFDEGDFRSDFNHTMELLENEAGSIEIENICDLNAKWIDKNEYDVFFNDELVKLGDKIQVVGKDSVAYNACDTSANQLNFFDDIQYDLDYEKELNDLLSVDTTIQILNLYSDSVTYTQSIDTLNRAEFPDIMLVEEKKAIIQNKRNPVQDFITGVEGFIDRIEKKAKPNDNKSQRSK